MSGDTTPAGSYKMPTPDVANPTPGAVDMLDYGSPEHSAELLEILRRRRIQLEMSCETMDEIAGWGSTRATKIMSKPPIRQLGLHTIFDALGALAFRIRIEHDPEQYEKIRTRLKKRSVGQDSGAVRKKLMRTAATHKVVRLFLAPDFMRKIAAKGGKSRGQKMTKRQRSRSARKAATARWANHVPGTSPKAKPPAAKPPRRPRSIALGAAIRLAAPRCASMLV